MARPQSKGKCVYCERVMSKGSMTRHLTSCPTRKDAIAAGEQAEDEKDQIYHVTVEGSYHPMFWLHVELRADAQLLVLDGFLRNIWLECCGHLSEFEFPRPKIPRRAGAAALRWDMLAMLDSDRDDPEDDMDRKIGDRVKKGGVFHHIYDFGSSTHLKLKVVGERQGCLDPNMVTLLARNLPPELLCECGSPAKFICTDCNWDGAGGLCEKCAKKHECGEDYLLPVVNSPRMGVCGYTG